MTTSDRIPSVPAHPFTAAVPRPGGRADQPLGIRARLALLWSAMLFVFAYVDIFGFWRADVAAGVRDGVVPVAGVTIDQSFLVLTTLYVLPPIGMLVATALAPARATRIATLVLAPAYAVSIAALAVGDPWAYYVLGSAVEVVLLVMITVLAWRWPRA